MCNDFLDQRFLGRKDAEMSAVSAPTRGERARFGYHQRGKKLGGYFNA